MDRRSVLKAGKVLPFPGMECEIDSVAGRGSNAVVYLGHYQDQQNGQLSHQVLIKELFPYEPKGLIYRDEQDCICVEAEAADTMELHRLSFLRGNEIHIRLQEKHPGEIDSNINTFEWNHTLYTILGFSGGRSLDKELQRGKNTVLREHTRRIRGALEVLGTIHASGYLHLDISPDNILLLGEGKRERVTLIDYNSVHTLEEIREAKSVYYSAKEGYTAPEIRAGRRMEIGFGTDLYAMTAVFYTCLTGKRLSVMQIVRSAVPDISGAECLRGCPSTVVSMVRMILKKGLAAIPRRRYQNVEEMLTDLEELEDRIDGKGITHWALWETGWANVRKAVKSNTALRYICEEEKVYPLRGTMESGERVSLMDMGFVYRQRDGRPLLLLGSGGMGKTTALLRMAYHQKGEYTAAEPAIAYLSLFGWKDGGETYIRDRILENLRFKEQTDSMETARHELNRLLSEPLHTKNGDRPALLLLLDGLNEASGGIEPLQKEISELAGLGGVQVILTSRSESTGLDCREIVLERLEREDVKKALTKQGLLAPENMELLELLHVPMLLSMFINTALAKERQLQISTKEELLKCYFSAIMEKEIRALPEDAPERWGIQAAVNYVLPEVAALIQKREAAVSDDELLRLIEDCYKELRKKPLTAVFPEWIGHSSDLKMGAENADVWYGKVVLDILWKRLGMIVRDEQGNFRILHQILEEYLSEYSAEFHREFDRQKKKQRNWKILAATGTIVGFVLVLSISFALYNSYMVNKISESNRQILANESKNLAYLSKYELSDGNIRQAVETAVSGLPSKQNERPYVAEAEKALSDAAGIYQDSRYLVTDEIFIGTNAKRFEYTADGACIMIMTDSDVVLCIDGKNGSNLWSRQLNEPYEYVDMDIVDDLNAVLLVGYNGSELLSLASGETLWEISFEERADAHSSDVSLIASNKQHMVLEFEARDVHGTCSSLQYLVFETQTGALISKTEDLLEKEIYQDYIAAQDTAAMKQTSYGYILDHNICFAAAEFGMMGNMDYWLIWFDIESGELIEYSIFQTDACIYLSEEDWLELYQGEIFSPEDKSLGTFTSIRDRSSFTGPPYIRFQAEEDERLNFELLLGSHPVFGFSDEAHMVLVYGNKIYGFGYGENIERITCDKEIVHCIEAVEGHTLCLFFSDGSIQYFNTKDFAKGNIRLNGRLIEKNIEAVEYRSENDALFYIMDSDNEGILYRCEKIEDDNSRYTDLPGGLFEEDTTYVTQDRSVLFSMAWDYTLNVYQAAVIDVQNDCAIENFTLDQVMFGEECLGISVERKLLLFQSFLYDWSSGEMIPFYPIDMERLEDLDIRFFETPLLYSEEKFICRNEYDEAYTPDKLYWFVNGKAHEISMIYDGANILEQNVVYKWDLDRQETHAYETKDNLVTGKSGVFLLLCSDDTADGEENPVITHYMVYSLETGAWNRIDRDLTDAAGSVWPVAAVGDVKRWIAVADQDNKIRLYDQSTDTYFQEYEIDADLEAVESLQFIMEDQYLAVRTKYHDIIIDADSGEMVYKQYREYCYYKETSYWWQDQPQELFIYCRCGTGVCIDTSTWVEKYEIDHLIFVSDQAVITNNYSYNSDDNGNYNAIVVYPYYSLEEKIHLAETRFL